jgi:hypothetical protein
MAFSVTASILIRLDYLKKVPSAGKILLYLTYIKDILSKTEHKAFPN